MGAPLALIEDGAGSGERVIALRGEIDVGSTGALQDWLARASGGGAHSVVVDFEHVDFMAVSGLYVLCEEQQRMAEHHARLTVVCDKPRILQLFGICRLADVLPIVARRSEVAEGEWGDEDDARTDRLREWLARYARTG